MVMLSANKSSSSETQMRVPRMHGLPKQTAGFTDIRVSKDSMKQFRLAASVSKPV